MRTRLRDRAQEKKNEKRKRKQNTQKTGLCERRNLVNCIHTPHPPDTTSTKDAQFSISLRTDSVFCILNETRPVGDLFSVQNTHVFFFFFSFFFPEPLLSGSLCHSCSQYSKVRVRVGRLEKGCKLKECSPPFMCGVS